jgi:hypothetical protein
MHINRVFMTAYASDHHRLVDWWTILLGRTFDRVPVPSCREWDLTDTVLFQVIESPQQHGALNFSARISNLKEKIDALRRQGIDVPTPQRVAGFDELWWTGFKDPEGNTVNLLEGASRRCVPVTTCPASAGKQES